ncbi:site-2 protease family protein [Patescibacteria group bacterium]|nr:site-2 protease family protein [Patescibacteria group bacterium]
MEYLFLVIVLIFSIVIHEVAHGAMANYLGDPTARYAGRLSLNPVKHLDPIGSVLLPLALIIMRSPFLIGWAKPVPVNPYNFRDQRYGSAKVAIAGPAANLSIALVFGLALRVFPILATLPGLYFTFNYIVYINILLAVFNLLPIPPLDGSHLLFTFLPYSMEKIKIFLSQYGTFILLFVILFLFEEVIFVIDWLFRLIVGSPIIF